MPFSGINRWWTRRSLVAVLIWLTRKMTNCVILAVLFVFAYLLFGMGPQLALRKYPIQQLRLRNSLFSVGKVKPFQLANRTKSTSCEVPKLEVFSKDGLPWWVSHDPVNCPTLLNNINDTKFAEVIAFTIKDGSNLHQLVDMDLSCCYQPFERETDDQNRYAGSCVAIQNKVTAIPRGINYIEVFCKNSSNNILYRDGFPLAHPPKLKNGNRMDNSRLNIVVIGLDATSNKNFQRFMPLSRKYLLSSNMSAITLHGYSVVGRGSLENLFPMWSGVSYTDLSVFCRRDWDNCPFIWQAASQRGYITNYAEDMQVFNIYYANAFKNQPTDYYLRPFAVQMKKYGRIYHPSFFCLGTRLGFQVFLDFVVSVSQVAQKENRPHFQFIWAGELAHDNMNSLGLGDVHLLNTLTQFKESGVVNNTVIMILGDHGNILTEYFQTPSGVVEYRLPVAHIVVPPWFKTKYPMEYSNMVENSRKRTTPYDIYETMMDIMDLGKDASSGRKKGRGISLFQNIPKKRYCFQLGIPLEWCNVCHPKIQLDPSAPLVKSAAEFVVKTVNRFSEHNRVLCHQLSLLDVVKAYKWDPEDIDMEACNPEGTRLVEKCTSTNNVEENNENRLDIVNLLLSVKPSGARFLADVKIIWPPGFSPKNQPEMRITQDDVVRVDRYWETGFCVQQFTKPFCICVNQTKV